ncbi:MAG: amidohydrolase family protein [bacterium]|nr:amidohydrolase family protein [bacterium]
MHLRKTRHGSRLALGAALLSVAAVGPVVATAAAEPTRFGTVDHETILIKAEKVIVRPGKVLENAQVLVEDGRIVAVGAALEAPADAQVIEGAVVCAGFIDPWSGLGLSSSAITDRNTSPATRSVDAFDRYQSAHALGECLRTGVTSVRVQAGMSSPIGGVGAVVRTDPEAGSATAVVLADSNAAAAIGVTSRGRATDVFDRISQVDKLRDTLEAARKYREDEVEYRHELTAWQEEIAKEEEKLEKGFKKAKKARDKKVKDAEEDGKEFKEKKYKEDKKPRLPKYDADKSMFARVVEGELPLVVTAHRVAELRELLQVTEPFGRLRLVVAGGTESLTVADELAERRIPVLVWPAPLGTSVSDELDGHDLSLAGQLRAKGVKVLLGSGGSANSRDLPLFAQLAVGHGLDAEAAFAAITYDAARALDVADRIGSVQRGRDADLLVLSGDPLRSSTQVRYVLSAGRVVVSPNE